MTERLVAAPPPPAPPRPWQFPRWQRVQAHGGTVLAAHLPGHPLAAVALVVDAGAGAEPLAAAGLALLTGRMLGEGTTDRDADAFGLAVERLGAGWHAEADFDSLRVGFDAPVASVPAVVSLLAEAVRTPALAEADIERIRADRLDELRAEVLAPNARAGAAFAAELFSPTSRYAVPEGGTLRSVGTITPDDVRSFAAQRLVPAAATLVVAADLDGLDVAELAERMYAGWAGLPPPAAAPAVGTRPAGRRTVVVHRADAVQSVLVVGHPGPPRSTPDYVATTNMGIALGGYFSSRLMQKLREERGYTYGAHAGFALRRHGGVFSARASVHTEVTGPAVADTLAEIERMHAHGVTEAELEQVRRYRAGVFPVQFASPYAVAGALGDLVVHGLPDDYFARVRELIVSTPRAEVDAAAAAHLHPDELVSVVVGDADAVRGPLEDAGAGPVTVVDNDG